MEKRKTNTVTKAILTMLFNMDKEGLTPASYQDMRNYRDKHLPLNVKEQSISGIINQAYKAGIIELTTINKINHYSPGNLLKNQKTTQDSKDILHKIYLIRKRPSVKTKELPTSNSIEEGDTLDKLRKAVFAIKADHKRRIEVLEVYVSELQKQVNILPNYKPESIFSEIPVTSNKKVNVAVTKNKLEQLKSKANKVNIKYHPSIGITALQNKINVHRSFKKPWYIRLLTFKLF